MKKYWRFIVAFFLAFGMFSFNVQSEGILDAEEATPLFEQNSWKMFRKKEEMIRKSKEKRNRVQIREDGPVNFQVFLEDGTPLKDVDVVCENEIVTTNKRGKALLSSLKAGVHTLNIRTDSEKENLMILQSYEEVAPVDGVQSYRLVYSDYSAYDSMWDLYYYTLDEPLHVDSGGTYEVAYSGSAEIYSVDEDDVPYGFSVSYTSSRVTCSIPSTADGYYTISLTLWADQYGYSAGSQTIEFGIFVGETIKVKISIYDELSENPIEGATIQGAIDPATTSSLLATTDEYGFAVFDGIELGYCGTEEITISAYGYVTQVAEIEITGPESPIYMDLYLERGNEMGDVTFSVEDAFGEMGGLTIQFTGEETHTYTGFGSGSTTDLMEHGTYQYLISKSGYQTASGTVTLTENNAHQTISVYMESSNPGNLKIVLRDAASNELLTDCVVIYNKKRYQLEDGVHSFLGITKKDYDFTFICPDYCLL
ncbi:MAG: hypothetical protein ACI4TK_13560 [Agathobacter sp.]